MEIVIDTCILRDTCEDENRNSYKAQEFVDFVFKEVNNCTLYICIDREGKILSEYKQKVGSECYGAFLIQRAQEIGKIRYVEANRSHPVCRAAKDVSSKLDNHDLTFLSVTIRTQDKKLFTNDTGFYEPVGEFRINRCSDGRPIPIEPVRNAGLSLFDVESWEKGFG